MIPIPPETCPRLAALALPVALVAPASADPGRTVAGSGMHPTGDTEGGWAILSD